MRRTLLAAVGAALLASAGVALAGYSGALGTLGAQNANAVAITGGTVDGATIGANTPAPVSGTTVRGLLTASGGAGGAGQSAAILGNGAANANDLKLGVDTSTAYGPYGAGWIQATSEGRVHTPLVLNPSGGAVVVGGAGVVGWPKLASAPGAPGAGLVQVFAVAGTNSGTCKLQVVAGTSATPVTIVDNVGAGC